MTDGNTKTSQQQKFLLNRQYAGLWLWMQQYSMDMNNPKKADAPRMSQADARALMDKTLRGLAREISASSDMGLTAITFRKWQITNAWIVNYSDPRPTAVGEIPGPGEKRRWVDVNPGQHTNMKTCQQHYLSDFNTRELSAYAEFRKQSMVANKTHTIPEDGTVPSVLSTVSIDTVKRWDALVRQAESEPDAFDMNSKMEALPISELEHRVIALNKKRYNAYMKQLEASKQMESLPAPANLPPRAMLLLKDDEYVPFLDCNHDVAKDRQKLI